MILDSNTSSNNKVCIFLNNVTHMRSQAFELSQTLEIQPVGQPEAAKKILDTLKADEDQTIQQKIQSCMKQICERLIPDIVDRLRSSEEQSVEVIKSPLRFSTQP